MPRIEAKQIQKELDQGRAWSVYWLYGQEKMKSRELLRRIRAAVLGPNSSASGASSAVINPFCEQRLDATECTASEVLDSAQNLSLGGGTRLVVIHDAHALREPEILEPLFNEGPSPMALKELSSVCVFVSKDLDGRKKFSKFLVENAAVVSCEEIPEEERDAWIQYLAKRRGLNIGAHESTALRVLEPWSLDIVDQELEKFSVSASTDAFLIGAGGVQGADHFLKSFFSKDLSQALQQVEEFANRPEECLPLLGLLSWHVRHLALVKANSSQGRIQIAPFLMERFQYWAKGWTLDEVLALQEELAQIDYLMKQTPRLPLGLWAGLVHRFCTKTEPSFHT